MKMKTIVELSQMTDVALSKYIEELITYKTQLDYTLADVYRTIDICYFGTTGVTK